MKDYMLRNINRLNACLAKAEECLSDATSIVQAMEQDARPVDWSLRSHAVICNIEAKIKCTRELLKVLPPRPDNE